ncbi:deaminase [Legionella feeleii]|uniref:Cytidine/deoxycytidylate deaminase n=1 Tax=Legionella feeleii TaxID=453 RepID=A0A378IV59_9GAMM|nr:deaminase [Legionella feeleii]STX38810.1 cytidine/deoxycytidylate deaminase [Legionella feeleii]
MENEMEVIIGIVAPLGTNRKKFIEHVETGFTKRGYHVEIISLTKSMLDIQCDNSESFKYYYKMQLCNNIRAEITNGFFAFFSSYIITQKRKELYKKGQRKIIFIIDQIKNTVECDILNYIYGLNYIQISLFSNEIERDKELKDKFSRDIDRIKELPTLIIDPDKKYEEIFTESLIEKIKSLGTDILSGYAKEVLPDVSHNLMKKDFEDIHLYKKENKESGQQISKLFHKSHYYFNLDMPQEKIDSELKKFIKQLFGTYNLYPTQDEFGMNLAYQSSVRSNFPGGRHIGAAIISTQGEVLSVASIRAPSKSSNTFLQDELKVTDGYLNYKSKIASWISLLENLNMYDLCWISEAISIDKMKQKTLYLRKTSKKVLYSVIAPSGEKICNKSLSTISDSHLITAENLDEYRSQILKETSEKGHTYSSYQLIQNTDLNEIIKFIGDSLEFHPCTHAEIAAIIDAAKIGISVKKSTLYTTTFPCHLCAKEIINSGINRVVYLEAYPKSKNKELYPNVIDFDPKNRTNLIPFDFYHGIGPKRFAYVYSLQNKDNKDNFPPLIRYQKPKYYREKEKDIHKYVSNRIVNRTDSSLNFLKSLFQDS